MVNFFQEQGYTNSTLLREALHRFYLESTENPKKQLLVEEKRNDNLGELYKKIEDMSEKLTSLITCYTTLSQTLERQEMDRTAISKTQGSGSQESVSEHKELKKNILSFRM